MRCPSCCAHVFPDQHTCPACGSKLGERPVGTAQGSSLLDQIGDRIEADQQRWRDQVYSGVGGVGVHGVGGRGTGLDKPAAKREVSPATVAIEGECIGILNMLLLHGGFSPFRSLAVSGVSAADAGSVRMTVSSAPPVVWTVSGTAKELAGPRSEPPLLAPDHEAFFTLDEATRGVIRVEVSREGSPLAASDFPVVVQSPNEWINAKGVEAALAGVVTPNSEAVSDVLKGIPGDFVAYQSSDCTNLVREIGAVYGAIRDLGLSYLGVPPSFEGTGQKVLFPDEVVGARRGCCIDIAVLTAAVLERVNYNPLIVMVADRERGFGHAYVGVWTAQIRAKQPVIRDRGLLLHAVAEGDLVVWNSTTYFDRDGNNGIETAVEIGTQMLEQLEYALDIAACRQHGLKPVPRRRA